MRVLGGTRPPGAAPVGVDTGPDRSGDRRALLASSGYGHRPFLALSPRLTVLSPPVTVAMGRSTTSLPQRRAPNDMAVTTTSLPSSPGRSSASSASQATALVRRGAAQGGARLSWS